MDPIKMMYSLFLSISILFLFSFLFVHIKKNNYFEYLPTFCWIFIMVIPFLFQTSTFGGEASRSQAVGVFWVLSSLFFSDYLSYKRAQKQQVLFTKTKLFDNSFAKIFFGVSILVSIFHIFCLSKVPLFEFIFSDFQKEKVLELAQYRELSSKLLDVPIYVKYIFNWCSDIFPAISTFLFIMNKSYVLAFLVFLFAVFYANLTLAKFMFFKYLLILIGMLFFTKKIYNYFLFKNKVFRLFLVFCISFALVKQYIDPIAMGNLELKDGETIADAYRRRGYAADGARDHARDNFLVEKMEKFVYRGLLVPVEVSNKWYTYYSQVQHPFEGWGGLLSRGRSQKNYIHPANKVGVWAYTQNFGTKYLPTVHAYASIDADAYGYFGFIGIFFIGALLFITRYLFSLMRSHSLVSHAIYLTSIITIAVCSPMASLQALLGAQGLLIMLAMLIVLKIYELQHAQILASRIFLSRLNLFAKPFAPLPKVVEKGKHFTQSLLSKKDTWFVMSFLSPSSSQGVVRNTRTPNETFGEKNNLILLNICEKVIPVFIAVLMIPTKFNFLRTQFFPLLMSPNYFIGLIILLAIFFKIFVSHRKCLIPPSNIILLYFSFLFIVWVSLFYTPSYEYGLEKTLELSFLGTIALFSPFFFLYKKSSIKIFFKALIAFGIAGSIYSISKEGINITLGVNYLSIQYAAGVAVLILACCYYTKHSKSFVKPEISTEIAFLSFLIILLIMGIFFAAGKMCICALAFSLIAYTIYQKNVVPLFIYFSTLLSLKILLPKSSLVTRFAFTLEKMGQVEDKYFYGERVGNLLSGIKLFLKNPVLGKGIGAFANYALDIPGFDRFKYPHNILVELLAETGMLGFLFYMTLIYSGFIILLKSLKVDFSPIKSALFAILIFSFFCALTSGNMVNLSLLICAGLAHALQLHMKAHTNQSFVKKMILDGDSPYGKGDPSQESFT